MPSKRTYRQLTAPKKYNQAIEELKILRDDSSNEDEFSKLSGDGIDRVNAIVSAAKNERGKFTDLHTEILIQYQLLKEECPKLEQAGFKDPEAIKNYVTRWDILEFLFHHTALYVLASDEKGDDSDVTENTGLLSSTTQSIRKSFKKNVTSHLLGNTKILVPLYNDFIGELKPTKNARTLAYGVEVAEEFGEGCNICAIVTSAFCCSFFKGAQMVGEQTDNSESIIKPQPGD